MQDKYPQEEEVLIYSKFGLVDPANEEGGVESGVSNSTSML